MSLLAVKSLLFGDRGTHLLNGPLLTTVSDAVCEEQTCTAL